MAHKGNENLRTPTSEQARKNGRKGGLASAAAKKKRKSMKEAFEVLMEMQTSPKYVKVFQKQGLTDETELTNEQALAFSMMAKAIAGDSRMASLILDVLGDKMADVFRGKELDLKEKELALKEKQAADAKTEALEKLDEILKGLHEQAEADKETE